MMPLIITASSALERRTFQDKEGQPFVIRSLESGDVEELARFYGEFEPKRRAHGLPPAGADRIEEWLDTVLRHGTHLVATRDHIIGHAFVVPTERQGVGEYAVFLHQDSRGRGVGTQLNRAMLDAARASGVDRLWLTVEPRNRAALRSYQKVGFEYVPRTRFSIEPEMEINLR